MDHFQSTGEGNNQRGRVPHQIIHPSSQATSFQNSASHRSGGLAVPSQPLSWAPHQSEAQPSVPHPPRKNLQNPHRPPNENHGQFAGHPFPGAQPPLGQNPQPTPPQQIAHLSPLLNPLSPNQQQQLITAYMMHSGAPPAPLATPFLFRGGAVPGPLNPPDHQALIEASPAPKYTRVETIVVEMRENMLKVLKTANYKRCKSAKNIRQALREVRTLCKEIRNETTELAKQKVNARKKAGTPEGEEGPAKKQKGAEAKDAKNPEEVPNSEGGEVPVRILGEDSDANEERGADVKAASKVEETSEFEGGRGWQEEGRSLSHGGAKGEERRPPEGADGKGDVGDDRLDGGGKVEGEEDGEGVVRMD